MDAGNAASYSQFSYCITAPIKDASKRGSNHHCVHNLGECLLTGALQLSVKDPYQMSWLENQIFRKRLNHECNLRHAREINEAAPEMKHVYRCLGKQSLEKASDISFSTYKDASFSHSWFSSHEYLWKLSIYRSCALQNAKPGAELLSPTAEQ